MEDTDPTEEGWVPEPSSTRGWTYEKGWKKMKVESSR